MPRWLAFSARVESICCCSRGDSPRKPAVLQAPALVPLVRMPDPCRRRRRSSRREISLAYPDDSRGRRRAWFNESESRITAPKSQTTQGTPAVPARPFALSSPAVRRGRHTRAVTIATERSVLPLRYISCLHSRRGDIAQITLSALVKRKAGCRVVAVRAQGDR